MTALEIFCDEAGHTGPRLLDPDQRIFTFASVAVPDTEAWSIINDARIANPVQMPELKARNLLRSDKGQRLVLQVLEAVHGRYSFVAYDKLLALCGMIFEYIYEPVYQHDPSLLYRKDLHRFVAMYCYIFFLGRDADGEEAIRQFERFMRTLDENEAPLLFGDQQGAQEGNPFELILQFAKGYRHLIIADNKNLERLTLDRGKWVLDLAISSLWSALNFWGRQGKPLRVVCDESKPLRDQALFFTGDAADPGIARARDVLGVTEGLGWKLEQPVSFGDSRDHPGLQIADIIAGTANLCLSHGLSTPLLERIGERMDEHFNRNSIMPDFERADIRNRPAAVNWLILKELADRAQAGADPLTGLADLYWTAEVSFARGDFHRHLNPS